MNSNNENRSKRGVNVNFNVDINKFIDLFINGAAASAPYAGFTKGLLNKLHYNVTRETG